MMAVGELHRVLWAGGQLRFFEHVQADSLMMRRVQRVLDATVWPRLMGGCYAGRDTQKAIPAAGFTATTVDRFPFPATRVPSPAATHILGTAERLDMGGQMSTGEDAPQLVPLADMTTAHASVSLLERLADKLGNRASVTAVYGEPVVAEGITVIPVAEVGFGFGGGAGREVGKDKTGEGGGGGGGAGARRVGLIEIQDGTATYKPLRDPWVDGIVPLAVALGGRHSHASPAASPSAA